MVDFCSLWVWGVRKCTCSSFHKERCRLLVVLDVNVSSLLRKCFYFIKTCHYSTRKHAIGYPRSCRVLENSSISSCSENNSYKASQNKPPGESAKSQIAPRTRTVMSLTLGVNRLEGRGVCERENLVIPAFHFCIENDSKYDTKETSAGCWQ